MSVPHSPAELQKLYQKRFAGMREYRDLVWRVLVDEYFAQWIPARAAVLDSWIEDRKQEYFNI